MTPRAPQGTFVIESVEGVTGESVRGCYFAWNDRAKRDEQLLFQEY